MAEIIRMPKMSDTMTEGVVAKWHKKTGDKIKSGDLLAEIETDKANMEFESFQEGTLLYIGVPEGKAAPVNAILAILGKEGEDFKALLEGEKSAAPAAAKPVQVKKEPAPAVVQREPVTTKASPVLQSEDTGNGRVKVSPIARKLAQEKGIDLSRIPGTGDSGRVVKRDIEWYKPVPFASPVSAGVTKESHEDVSVSQMRKTIARRLSESKFTAPHFYLTMEVNMDRAHDAREAINAVNGVKISFNDMVVKACAASLRQHPRVNASWMEEVIRYYHHIHIGVAVAVDDGLLVPVVRFADSKTLSQVAGEVKDFSQRAKDKKLQPADWEGSTFTISNLGMFGIEEFTAIINSPDACILAVGAIKKVPAIKEGRMAPARVMKVTLSCDHRVVDGATGAKFLQTFKYLLENPVILLGAGAV